MQILLANLLNKCFYLIFSTLFCCCRLIICIGATLYVTVVTSESGGSPPLFQSGICNLSSNSKFKLVLFLLPEAFCGLKHAENAIAAGALPGPRRGSSRCASRPPSRLGRAHSSPYPTPLGAFGASILAPSAPRSL